MKDLLFPGHLDVLYYCSTFTLCTLLLPGHIEASLRILFLTGALRKLNSVLQIKLALLVTNNNKTILV